MGTEIKTHLCYPADVLIAVLLGEAKVLVQPKAYIVAVETVCAVPEVQEVLLEGCCDGGFARCRETGEPDCEALLLAECVALSARERGVPCDVAASDMLVILLVMAGYGGAHVAMLIL